MRSCCYLIMLFLIVNIFCSASVFAVSNDAESIDSVGDVINISDPEEIVYLPNIDIISAKVSDNNSFFFFILEVDGVIENSVPVSYGFRISSLSNTSRRVSLYYSQNRSYLSINEAPIICDNEVSINTLKIIVNKDNLSYIEGPWSIAVSANMITDDEMWYRDTVNIANYDPVFDIDDSIDDGIDNEEPDDSSSTPGFLLVAIVFALAVIVLFKKVVR